MRRILPAFLVLAISPAFVHAHALGVDCKLKDGKVHVEAFYDDDSAAHDAKVQVLDATEKVVAKGMTDKKGLWSFDAPEPGKYVVHVDAGAGHRAKKTIEIPTAAPRATDETVSVGATRAEFTSFPWLKVGIGLGAIGTLSGGFFLASLFRKGGRAANPGE